MTIDEEESGRFHEGQDDRELDRLTDASQEDEERDREERGGVRHDWRPDEMREVAAEAEGDRRHGEKIGDQHQPARHEADPRPERERRVLELGRVLRPHRTEAGVRIGGEPRGDAGEQKGEPERVAREPRRRADERVDPGPEDDPDPGD